MKNKLFIKIYFSSFISTLLRMTHSAFFSYSGKPLLSHAFIFLSEERFQMELLFVNLESLPFYIPLILPCLLKLYFEKWQKSTHHLFSPFLLWPIFIHFYTSCTTLSLCLVSLLLSLYTELSIVSSGGVWFL